MSDILSPFMFLGRRRRHGELVLIGNGVRDETAMFDYQVCIVLYDAEQDRWSVETAPKSVVAALVPDKFRDALSRFARWPDVVPPADELADARRKATTA